MDNEIEVQNVELENETGSCYDLENVEDCKELETKLGSNSMFFKPENDITYQISLTTTKIREVEKTFGDDVVTKYELGIKAVNAKGVEFEGLWEVGKSILEPIFKGYEKDAVFKITRTGSGMDTRYSVVKDF